MASAETQKPDNGQRSDQLPHTENDFVPSHATEQPSLSNEQPPLSNEQPIRRPTRQLDFYQAMSDFKKMFPTMDCEVIEAVLRTNDGAVDATIDQLLTMTIDADDAVMATSLAGHTADFEESIPMYSEKADSDSPPSYLEAMRTYTHESMWTTPVSGTSSKKSPNRKEPRNILDLDADEFSLSNSEVKKSISTSPISASNKNTKTLKSKHHYWNPPMLGTLPDDFLRLTPSGISPPKKQSPSYLRKDNFSKSGQQLHKSELRSSENADKLKSSRSKSDQKRHAHHRNLNMPGTPHAMVSPGQLSSDMLQKKMKENEKQRRRTSLELDPELSQYLEDERLAILLQNSVFLEELRRNDDFMKALEKDRMNASAFEPCPVESVSPPLAEPLVAATELDSVHKNIKSYGRDNQMLDAFPFSQPIITKDEDAELRGKLKNMGGASRKQFAALAKRFFSRKKKKSPKQMLKENIAPSRVNLLDEEEEELEEDLDLSLNGYPFGEQPQMESLPGSVARLSSYRTVQRHPYQPQAVTSYQHGQQQDLV